MAFIEKIIGFFQDLYLRISEKIGKLTDAEKRRLILVSTAAFSVILTISVVVSVVNSSGHKQPPKADKNTARIPIPAEEIFLPQEPDFVPGVLLERERRTSWSEEDAAVFWKDPLVNGEEPWREKIEASIDEYLERVP